MKIVHVTLRFDAPGGVETNVRELTRRLRAGGDEVEVFASDLYDEAAWDRRSNFRPEVDGVPVRRFPVRKRLVPRLTLPLMVGLIDALAESGADVIHAHSHRYGHVLQAAAVARRCGIPLVISTSYHPADRRESWRNRQILRLDDFAFGMTAYRIARAIVVQSEQEARLLREFAPADRLRIVPPGVDLAEWSDPARDRADELRLPPEYFLYAGRVAANKGLPNLVDALAALPPAARRPLVLMGKDWGERAAVEARARDLGVTDLLVWLGHVPDRSTYRAVFRGARAFVLPSEWEAYGFVLLEAMAARTPIVATAVGAVPEVLGDGGLGLLVPYGEAAAMGDALRSILDDPEGARARVERGWHHVQGLDWAASAERFRALYREVAGR
ncbi:MAG: glycosyltransferase family 4 protein [Thermoplasmata archaeon]